MIRVVIADDQAVIREGLKFILEQNKDIKVVGCVGNGNEAYAMCTEYKPDVILMDVVMPVCDGVEGTRLIKGSDIGTKVLILTTFNDDEKIAEALKNGADGYVLKDIDSDELILTIKSIYKGLRVMHEDAYSHVIRQLRTSSAAVNIEPEDSRDPGLTDREIEIIKMIVFGKSNREIAASLYMTEGSIRNLISSILLKVNLKSRTQLAVFAVRHNII
ncbi:MAG TPA: response regulator transcription factor [Clostridia bacterium]|nr:response regulator transcription factor [Clostridia bacterium]